MSSSKLNVRLETKRRLRQVSSCVIVSDSVNFYISRYNSESFSWRLYKYSLFVFHLYVQSLSI